MSESKQAEAYTLTVKQFATRMQISMPTAYDFIKRDGFPRLRAGAKILIPKEQLERWLDEQASGGN